MSARGPGVEGEEGSDKEGEEGEVREKNTSLKLLLIFKDFDDKLMQEAVKTITR